MSSCISGGGRTYGFDLDIVKSPSTSSRTSHSSSPSSTLSESINSPLALSTRKPRTPRKRPNQTYNEAAALLSTVYPNIFSTKNLRKPSKHTKIYNSLADDFDELLPPSPGFNNVEFLLHQQPIPDKPTLRIEIKPNSNSSDFQSNSPCPCDTYKEADFDAESILDEEVEEGIDSIMGNLSVDNESQSQFNPYCWNPMVGLGIGGKFDFGFGTNGGVSALRHTDDVDWWRFPTVDVLAISPKLNKVSPEKKKKKKKVERVEELKISELPKEISNSNSNAEMNSKTTLSAELSLGLKLNHEKVLTAWSGRGSPFSDDILGTESSESDAIVCFLLSPAGI
ncbi:Chloroplast import apparatus 2-like [Thalictrum thalictroides]|uniref:Chloroplast import apparatus 2-like n=1 Tax=Thalictrum thalictroides TaxID=46969 RepID=A0A7J6XEN9_THATH|nr:Chloroplast import apparatus 2-like [Thalictrum thalictroides]